MTRCAKWVVVAALAAGHGAVARDTQQIALAFARDLERLGFEPYESRLQLRVTSEQVVGGGEVASRVTVPLWCRYEAAATHSVDCYVAGRMRQVFEAWGKSRFPRAKRSAFVAWSPDGVSLGGDAGRALAAEIFPVGCERDRTVSPGIRAEGSSFIGHLRQYGRSDTRVGGFALGVAALLQPLHLGLVPFGGASGRYTLQLPLPFFGPRISFSVGVAPAARGEPQPWLQTVDGYDTALAMLAPAVFVLGCTALGAALGGAVAVIRSAISVWQVHQSPWYVRVRFADILDPVSQNGLLLGQSEMDTTSQPRGREPSLPML